MACGGCGTEKGLTKEQVENLINKLIDDGKLSGGLKGCDGEKLSPGAKVVLCDTLTKIINDAIKDGEIDVVKDVDIKNGKLVVTKGDGTKEEIDLPYVKAQVVGKDIIFTLPDGSTAVVPMKDNAVTKDMFGNTIKENAIVEGKFDVNAEALAGKGLKKDDNGKLAIDPSTLAKPNTNPNNAQTIAGSGLRDDGDGGLRVDPEDFIDNETIIKDPTTGRIKVKPKACVDMTNGNLDILSNGLGQPGTTCWYGYACGKNEDGANFIIGVPADPTNKILTHTTAAQSKNDFIFGCADVSGYQVATPTEIIQYFYDDYGGSADRQNSGWMRMHSGGLKPDGTLANGSWTRWERIGAIPDPDGGLSSLTNRVTELENRANRPCAMDVKTKEADYTATAADEMLVFNSSATVTFPANDNSIPIGKSWTIVCDKNDSTITIASNGNIRPPYKGSLKVKGANAVVTVVKTAADGYRVFGQTENA